MVTTIKKGTPREKILLALKKRPAKIKSHDLKKYCGSISLQEDPIELQKNGAMNGNNLLLDTYPLQSTPFLRLFRAE